MLGYELKVAPTNARPIACDPKLLAELKTPEEDLARVEHYRWMTWRVPSGWQHGSPRDNVRLLHPDIVPYEQLVESTREKDRAVVRALVDLLQAGQSEVLHSPSPVTKPEPNANKPLVGV